MRIFYFGQYKPDILTSAWVHNYEVLSNLEKLGNEIMDLGKGSGSTAPEKKDRSTNRRAYLLQR